MVLSQAQVRRLIDEIKGFVGYELTIDLGSQSVTSPGGDVMAFDITPHRKYCLLNGFDDIGLTLQHSEKIKAFESARRARHPYYFNAKIA